MNFIKKMIEKTKYNRLKLKSSVVGNYSLKDLETKDELLISANITLKEVENLIYSKENALLKFTYHPQYANQDERPYYEKLSEIFKILDKHNRPYKISIYVENRELFKQSKSLDYIKNINLIINSDYNKYTKEEYLSEEEKLDSLIYKIKSSNLSPYEKYLAVYNIVKQFKEYKENLYEPYKARNIKEILQNEYIVCVGFSNLLTILLDKVGIPCITISARVEDNELTSYIDFKERPILLSGHERNLVKIDDDKYNIHGIYMADATWDNHMKIDLYNTASITYDKLKESKSLEELRDDDFFFDVHSFEEYNQKMNVYLKREMKMQERLQRKGTYKEKVLKTHKYIYNKILKLLYKLDYEKWLELTEKYNNVIDEIDDEITPIKDIEKIYSDFLTEFGYYILEIINKEIDINTTFEAATNVKRIINGYNEEEIQKWFELTKEIHEECEILCYPYKYDPNNKRINYLEEKQKTKCLTRK